MLAQVSGEIPRSGAELDQLVVGKLRRYRVANGSLSGLRPLRAALSPSSVRRAVAVANATAPICCYGGDL